jgi:hypothetical protein
MKMVMGMTMPVPVQTRKISQSVAYRIVGMTWIVNIALHPLFSYELGLHGIILLDHVTNCKTFLSIL